jgi:hypothetical protein
MNRARLILWAALLSGALPALGCPRTNADTTVTLEGVTFADGANASGFFELNSYGYLEAADITTSPGTSISGAALSGYTYLLTGAAVANTPVFDTVFTFNSTAEDFSLILIAADPVTVGGADPLVVGQGSGGSLTVSNEYCTENSLACGGVNNQDGRLVTAGALYAPEPASLGLLAVGGLLVPLIRRRRNRQASGAA